MATTGKPAHAPSRRDRRHFHPRRAMEGIRFFRRMLLAEALILAAAVGAAFVFAYTTWGGHSAEPHGGTRAAVALTILLGAALAAMLMAAVRVSQRICGPMNKIKDALNQISRGEDPGKITIREEDDLHDLIAELNGAVEAIRLRKREEANGAPPVTAEVLSILGERRGDEARTPPRPAARRGSGRG